MNLLYSVPFDVCVVCYVMYVGQWCSIVSPSRLCLARPVPTGCALLGRFSVMRYT